jgi:hypothetical protein
MRLHPFAHRAQRRLRVGAQGRDLFFRGQGTIGMGVHVILLLGPLLMAGLTADVGIQSAKSYHI